MTREDYIWVGIRIFGIYMLVLAITNLPGFITGLYYVSRTWSREVAPNGGSEILSAVQMNQILHTSHAKLAITRILRALIFTGAAWYLLCRGSCLFSLVNTQNPLSENPAEPDNTAEEEDVSVEMRSPRDDV